MSLKLVRDFGAIAKTAGGIDLMKASWGMMRNKDVVTKAYREKGANTFPVMTQDDWRWVVFYALGFEEDKTNSIEKRAALARENPVWDALYFLVAFKGFDSKTGQPVTAMDRLGYTNALLFVIANLDEEDRQGAFDDMFPNDLNGDESAILFDMLSMVNEKAKKGHATELHKRLSVPKSPKRVIPVVQAPVVPMVPVVPVSPVSAEASQATQASDDSQEEVKDNYDDFLPLETEIANLDEKSLEDLVDALPFATARALRSLLNAKFA